MTIRTHHTQQILDVLMKTFSRQHVSMPTGMDRRFLSDVGLSQSDILALQVR
jgi:hypothetical protein